MPSSKKDTKNEIMHLECKGSGSNKFYDLELVQGEAASNHKFEVIARWGRIGTKGSYQTKGSFNTRKVAADLIEYMINQKISKGYKLIQKTIVTPPKKKKPPQEESLKRFSDILE